MTQLALTLVLAVAPAARPSAALRAPELEVVPLESPCEAGSRLPSLVAGADGSTWLSWVEEEPGGAAVLRCAALGSEGWGEVREVVRAEDLFLNWADFPSLAVLGDGTLAAAWLRRGADPHGYDALVALSRDAGASWSTPRRLHDHEGAVEHGFVSIAPLDEAHFALVWLDGRASEGAEHGHGQTALFARILSAAGEFGPEGVVDPRVCDCCQTSLVALGAGRLACIYRDRSEQEVRDVFVARYEDSAWQAPAPVHADGWRIPGCPVNGPRLAVGDARLSAAWFTAAGELAGGVFVASADEAGAFGAPVRVDGGNPVGRVDLAPWPDGRLLVTWLEYTSEGGEWRARLVSRRGGRGSARTVARVTTERASGSLRLAARGGEVLAAWTSDEGGVELARLRPTREEPR